ncbi:MAG TPA: hypothetical protein GYA08_02625 [Chloroflexi bacterium]|nr:hypothetical protein [Chloroflexota bacterium]
MRFWGLVAIVMVGVFAFVVGQRLSADAVGMAVGVLFGVLAGIPAALLMVAAGRRREAEFEDDAEEEFSEAYPTPRGRGQPAYGAMPAQAPVIVFAPPAAPAGAPYAGYTDHYVPPQAPAYQHTTPQRALPGPGAAQGDGRRAFKVVGEQEEWITEW